jgi:hypothetical protein
MPTYLPTPESVNPETKAALSRTLANLREAQARLEILIVRLQAAAAPYIAEDIEERHDATRGIIASLRASLEAAGRPAKTSLMPKYEPRERECSTCAITSTTVDYVDPFDIENAEMICPACAETERLRPYAPLADEEEAR